MSTEVEKIAIFGLNNAGKTSIIKTVSQDLTALKNLLPTHGVERTGFKYLGRELVFWDFGGQEKYRESYINNPSRNFENIGYAFYVIDVQDKETIEISAQYFIEIVHQIYAFSPNSKYILLFHKNDPEKKENITQMDLKGLFLDKIDSTIETITPRDSSGTDTINIHETSIFNPKTIIDAFSKLFIENNDRYETISKILKSFVKFHDLAFANLITSNFMDLGSASADWLMQVEIDELYKFFMNSVIPNSDVRIEMSLLEETYPFKFISSGFDLTLKKRSVPFILIICFAGKSEEEEAKIKSAFEVHIGDLKRLLIDYGALETARK